METEEQNLSQYLEILWRRKWIVALLTLLVTLAALSFTLLQSSTYEAKTTILIEREEGLGRLLGATGDFFIDRGILTQMELIESRNVLERALLILQPDNQLSPTQVQLQAQGLRDTVRVSQVGTTDLVEITASAPKPLLAQQRANAVAEGYLQHSIDSRVAAVNQALAVATSRLDASQQDPGVAQLYAQLQDVQQELELAQAAGQIVGIRIVDPALLPTSPVGPRLLFNLVLGFGLGLLLGVTGAFGLHHLDRKIRTDLDVKQAVNLPIMGLIPQWQIQTNPHLVPLDKDPKSAFAEAFRVLRANLQFAAVDHPLQCILVTSPGPTDGKTIVAINLAQAFALEDRRVLLIDGDLRRPSIHGLFDLTPDKGLSTLLSEGDNLTDHLVQQEGVDILPAGPRPPNPAELLGSQRLLELLGQFREKYEVIIIDSPPVLGFADTLVLAKRVDGTLLLLRAGQTDRGAASEAREALEGVDGTVVGAIVNGVQPGYRGYRYRYYYKYYGEYETDGAGRG